MCPPRYLPPNGGAIDSINGMRYGFAPNIPHVSMWGMPVFADGGMVDESPPLGVMRLPQLVDESHVNIPDGVLKKNDPDRVLVRLMPGELVVPKKHVPLVSQFLKENGIKLSGM